MRTSRPRLTFGFLFCAVTAASACNTYDSSLLEGGAPSDGGGASGAGTNVGASGGGGEGGMVACESPSECPGMDTECGTRTCEGGTCGVDAAPMGTVADSQTPGDCISNECNGSGAINGVPDDADLPNDDNDCTTDVCDRGIPDNVPLAPETECDGGVCNADGNCVECITGAQCPLSNVCTDRFTCAPASCDDDVQNPGETDEDCGGTMCPACPIGDTCLLPTDCLSGECGGIPLTCQESCTDTMMNQDETDVDCGGECDPCDFGEGCEVAADCSTGACSPTDTCTCNSPAGVLLISEIRTRGPAATSPASNEFVEIFNPTSASITFGATWTLESRDEGAASYTVRYTGEGQVIGPGRHLLLGGSQYVGPPTADDMLASGITDEASVVLKNGAVVSDAVCMNCGANNFSTHTCEGMPAAKVGCTNNVDKSIERKPGAAQGNCIDTGDNAADFAELSPSNPQNLASPATP